MKKILRFLISRVFWFSLLIVVQIGIFAVILFNISSYSTYLYAAFVLFSLIIVIWLVAKDDNPSYKITWIILIMTLPVVGWFFYLKFGNKTLPHRYWEKIAANEAAHPALFTAEEGDTAALLEQYPHHRVLTDYIRNISGFPAYGGTQVEYAPLGEDFFRQLMRELPKAKKFIFLEYFIVREGYMWGRILEILKEKVNAGVEVRVLYDGTCAVALLPYSYPQKLEKLGIACKMFAPLRPFVSTHYNYRDHRKIMVIDGQIAFTGGVNLADEYINKIVRFGYWKDSGVRLDGPGAASLANIFLTFWKAKYPDEDLDAGCDLPAAVPVETDCLVQPFADTPVDREAVAKNVYLELINQAQKRLYICTPYLILDNDLLSCLRLAAKRGVDVRIYTPGVPDKPTIYQLTRSYFPHLLRAGVKIYSYTPGFLHAKTWLVDDRIAAVGTVNLDYRSLYLHFENSVLLYGGAVLDDVRRDLAEIEKESAAVTLADCRTGFFGTLYSAVLRLVAPLC